MAVSIEVLTLFPPMVTAYASESILGKAQEKGILRLRVTDIRAYAEDKHRTCDDAPYGGGAGMVMKIEPIVRAIEDARLRLPHAQVYFMSPRGRLLTQSWVREIALEQEFILLCGRYEGVDERILDYVDVELCVGDYILTGGELAALIFIDTVARRVPGVLGNLASASNESFEEGLLEYPQYTRPPDFRGASVPAVLLSGDHARIQRWRRWKSLALTMEKRPELRAEMTLSESDTRLLRLSEDEL